MATFERGILGGFSGKVGTVIGCAWKSLDVMKAIPRKRSDNPTQEQLEHRLKFSLVIPIFRALAKLLRKTFHADNMSGANGAQAYNFRHMITGTYPSYGINYATVVLSKGVLLEPEPLPLAAVNPGEIVFNWKNNSADDALVTDRAVVISYCPEAERAAYRYTSANRGDGSATLEVPAAFSGKVVHTWMLFLSKEGVSDSEYCGSITVL